MHVNVYFVYVTRRRLIAFDPIGHSLLFPPVPFFIRLRTYLRSFSESLLEIKESRKEVKTKSAYRIVSRNHARFRRISATRDSFHTYAAMAWSIRSAWIVVKDTVEVRRLEVKSCAAWCRVCLEFQRDPLLNSGTSGRISRRRARETCNGRRERISLARSR